MKRTYALPLLLSAMALVTLPACKDKDNEEKKTEEMTVDETKEYITGVGQEITDKFRPEDQAEVLELCSYFEETYSHLDLPDDFTFITMNPAGPDDFMRNIRRATRSGSPSSLTRAASTVYSYSINFNNAAGVYEPGLYSWNKVPGENTRDIVFRFKDAARRNCELRISPSTDTWGFGYTEEYEYYDETYNYTVKVPAVLTATLTQGGNSLAEMTVGSNCDLNGHTLTASVRGTIANISFSGDINATDSEIRMDASCRVSGTELASENITVNGKNMCNVEYLAANLETNPQRIFTGAKGHAAVLGGKINCDANARFNADVLDALDNNYWSGYGNDTYSEDYNEAREYAKIINDNIKSQINFGATKQADIVFEAEPDKSGSYYSIEIVPMLRFTDGSTMSFEEYGRRGFLNLQDDFSALIDSYTRFLRR